MKFCNKTLASNISWYEKKIILNVPIPTIWTWYMTILYCVPYSSFHESFPRFMVHCRSNFNSILQVYSTTTGAINQVKPIGIHNSSDATPMKPESIKSEKIQSEQRKAKRICILRDMLDMLTIQHKCIHICFVVTGTFHVTVQSVEIHSRYIFTAPASLTVIPFQ